jgi:hypothetical protein
VGRKHGPHYYILTEHIARPCSSFEFFLHVIQFYCHYHLSLSLAYSTLQGCTTLIPSREHVLTIKTPGVVDDLNSSTTYKQRTYVRERLSQGVSICKTKGE